MSSKFQLQADGSWWSRDRVSRATQRGQTTAGALGALAGWQAATARALQAADGRSIACMTRCNADVSAELRRDPSAGGKRRTLCRLVQSDQERHTTEGADQPSHRQGGVDDGPGDRGTFAEAEIAVGRDRLTGLGFVFVGDGIVGVDLDMCRDPVTGVLTDRAQKIITDCHTYAEVSPRGHRRQDHRPGRPSA